MKARTDWYEPHPVTPERKRELVSRGYRVIDARFAPPGWRGESADDVKAQETVENAPLYEGDDGFEDDDALRAAIHAATGKAPHWKTKRSTLISQYKALRDADS